MCTNNREVSCCSAIFPSAEGFTVDRRPADRDLTEMSREQLTAAILTLRSALRWHRDLRGNDRCWLDDLALYELLPEGGEAEFTLPPREEFLRNCSRYWEKRRGS